MLLNIDNFKNDLRELKKKYKLSVKEHSQYNGMDEYMGEDQYFVVGQEQYYVQTVAEIVEEIFVKKS